MANERNRTERFRRADELEKSPLTVFSFIRFYFDAIFGKGILQNTCPFWSADFLIETKPTTVFYLTTLIRSRFAFDSNYVH